jgi:hypothetical protein
MDEKHITNDSQPETVQSILLPKDNSQPNLPIQNIKKLNEAQGKDLSNEVIYFSINQDSKLVLYF